VGLDDTSFEHRDVRDARRRALRIKNLLVPRFAANDPVATELASPWEKPELFLIRGSGYRALLPITRACRRVTRNTQETQAPNRIALPPGVSGVLRQQ
jgi:hypothetical protein